MKAETSIHQNLTEENLCIPLDMVLGILNIVVKEALKHEITEVVENRSLLYLSVFLDQKETKHQKILQNIHNLLTEYKEYRYEESEQLNWREE